ncbi:uncharacterized protein LOC128547066 [Mercenaria mercenaria]|uniref:uncharacterized protein LOC128547066 n=1 Tax=Mercenaria mercenaria TaxID=6596 RepID=UPI00234F5DDC|nr:uncharacterized protein LOC128547066 [Mercenaria mercenaria]XP_053374737.1 uncharacterized protein LOC128547066 [Mercenaria mercenaria]XP_053374738.1 uncharacterized protein LOC128547066 [Mercenaria mercenaria]
MLLYADDIVLVANSAENLQAMLNKMHEWCKPWRVLINCEKSKVMHFRKGRAERSDHQFTVGDNQLETVDSYKYLGIILHDKHDFSYNCESLSKGAGRALGSVISKIHCMKNCGFKTFQKLYNSCVVPILDYSASVWGFKHFQAADSVQNRAIRYYLGVHRFTPKLALLGETGWIPSTYRRWICIIRYWNRLVKLNDNRITKRVFNKDYQNSNIVNNWCNEVKTIMTKLDLITHFNNKVTVDMDYVKSKIGEYYAHIWKSDYEKVPKLRTYKTFKTQFSCENYLSLNLKRNRNGKVCRGISRPNTLYNMSNGIN